MGSFDTSPLALSISWDQQKGKGTKAELMLCFCLHHCLSMWQGLLGGELNMLPFLWASHNCQKMWGLDLFPAQNKKEEGQK